MLRIMVLIQCDICDGFLNQIAVAENPRGASGRDPDESLPSQLHDLQLTAEEYGWQSTHDSTVHYCSDCNRP